MVLSKLGLTPVGDVLAALTESKSAGEKMDPYRFSPDIPSAPPDESLILGTIGVRLTTETAEEAGASEENEG